MLLSFFVLGFAPAIAQEKAAGANADNSTEFDFA
jgi:hypothetical protein